jgi:hypothetical protein
VKYSETLPAERPFDMASLELIAPAPEDTTGTVYFIVCRETERCKIGFTKGDPLKRLRNMQTGAAGELRLLAAQPGNIETERALHERFSSQNVHGEWFDVTDELFAYMCAVVWVASSIRASQGMPLEPWMLSGLRMLDDGMTDLPPHLKKLIDE